MPNQDNYPDQLPEIPNQNVPDASGPRVFRISEFDLNIIQKEDEEGDPKESAPVFGIDYSHVVEVYVYDELNNIVGHLNIRPGDTLNTDQAALLLVGLKPSQQSGIGIGQDNLADVLRVNLSAVFSRLELPEGRYFITLNFFDDEIGKEYKDDSLAVDIEVNPDELELDSPDEYKEAKRKNQGPRLYIADISPSRKELKLRPTRPTDEMMREIREFVEPSVPKFVAQALIDQLFGATTPFSSTLVPIEEGIENEEFNQFTDGKGGFLEVISWTKFLEAVNEINGTTLARVDRANLEGILFSIFTRSRDKIRDKALDELANYEDRRIQNNELQGQIIREGVREAMLEMIDDGEIDRRFDIIV